VLSLEYGRGGRNTPLQSVKDIYRLGGVLNGKVDTKTVQRLLHHPNTELSALLGELRMLEGDPFVAKFIEHLIAGRLIDEAALERAQARVTDDANAMALRRQTVEHPFGTLKYRIFSHGRFLLRGLHGAGTEMALAVLAYNLRRACNVLGLQNITSHLQAAGG